MPRWVKNTQQQLVRSSRPGYSDREVSADVVTEWLSVIKDMGVKSIICLLTEEQLGYYEDVPGGLLKYYRDNGFQVVSYPITDPHHDPKGWNELEEALPRLGEIVEKLSKPVLVHCSAGVDRTGRVVRHYEATITAEQWRQWAED